MRKSDNYDHDPNTVSVHDDLVQGFGRSKYYPPAFDGLKLNHHNRMHHHDSFDKNPETVSITDGIHGQDTKVKQFLPGDFEGLKLNHHNRMHN